MSINAPSRPALYLAALCVVAILAPIPRVFAAAPTSTIGVSATVQATCLISTSPLAFGTYTGALISLTTTITVTCTNTTPYNVGIGPGTGTSPAATVTTRHMNGTSTAGLAYTLKSGSQGGPNWGVTVGTDTVAGTATGVAQPMTVYGSVAAGLYIAPGTYTDTVIATVIYWDEKSRMPDVLAGIVSSAAMMGIDQIVTCRPDRGWMQGPTRCLSPVHVLYYGLYGGCVLNDRRVTARHQNG